jgi:hypothetical protein
MKLHYKEKTMPEQRYSKFVFRPADTKEYRFPTHAAKLLMDRSEAETSEAFLVMLGPGEAPSVHVPRVGSRLQTWWPPGGTR